jgi:hypothetical protein
MFSAPLLALTIIFDPTDHQEPLAIARASSWAGDDSEAGTEFAADGLARRPARLYPTQMGGRFETDSYLKPLLQGSCGSAPGLGELRYAVATW